MTIRPRHRGIYVAATIFVAAIALSTRTYADWYPPLISTYGGDTLWAMAVFLTLGAICPTASRWRLVAIAGAGSLLVELSQLYHARWIDAIRGTLAGKLLLGFDFLASDLVCYGVGIVAGLLLDWSVLSRLGGDAGQESRDR